MLHYSKLNIYIEIEFVLTCFKLLDFWLTCTNQVSWPVLVRVHIAWLVYHSISVQIVLIWVVKPTTRVQPITETQRTVDYTGQRSAGYRGQSITGVTEDSRLQRSQVR